MNKIKKLYRSRNNRMIAGICGGLADYWNTDATLIRIGMVFVSLLPGPSVIFYIVAWIIIPLEPEK